MLLTSRRCAASTSRRKPDWRSVSSTTPRPRGHEAPHGHGPRVRPDYTVATECGFGRRVPETIPSLLRLHLDGPATPDRARPEQAREIGEESMSGTRTPDSVHLAGSIGLDTVEEVFGTVGKLLGPYLRRIPDGEVGAGACGSAGSIPCCGRIHCCGRTRRARCVPPTVFRCSPWPRRRSSALRFGELGYAREARASYLDFVAARDLAGSGRHPLPGRLPTPFGS